jgi:hypothetical protein
MSGSIGMRSVPSIHGRVLPTVVAVLTLWGELPTATVAAADPPSASKPAPLLDAERTQLLAERDRFDRQSAQLQAHGKYAALREAQLWILNNPNQIPTLAAGRGANFDKVVQLPSRGKRVDVRNKSSPFLWAGFVISGAGQ